VTPCSVVEEFRRFRQMLCLHNPDNRDKRSSSIERCDACLLDLRITDLSESLSSDVNNARLVSPVPQACRLFSGLAIVCLSSHCVEYNKAGFGYRPTHN